MEIETKCSSLARAESGGVKDPINVGAVNARTETRNQQEPFSNGVAKSSVPSTTASNNDLLSKITSTENGDVKSKTEKET
ncbi:unnamed protein product [Camellia sinensis]